MKLYEVNQEIENIFEQIVDPETGEILSDSDELMEQLDALQMRRMEILEYLAKLVLNTRSDEAALKAEEKRLKARRERIEKQEASLMKVIDRECCGEKTDLGIATVSYRHSEKIRISDAKQTLRWLMETGHDNCYRVPDPEIKKGEVKALLTAGEEVPGAELEEAVHCSLK